MLDAPEDIAAIAGNWLARFEHALTNRDPDALTALFHPDSHWRDVLVLTWRIDTVSGRDGIVRSVQADPDYTHRPEPAETVAVLREMVEKQ